ncbi:MAG: hypothetical protein RLZZ387_379 [Chloroflexota bacterium]|jgi:hypothetical protein
MTPPLTAHPWREVEITLTAAHEHPSPYTSVEVWADFTHESGRVLRRPAFWDGGRTWKLRFASPLAHGAWSWRSAASVPDEGLADATGEIVCLPGEATNRFYARGFWRMSPGGRNLVHADGTLALLAGDTAWALPWRATLEQAREYAADRRAKGFNAALLMTVQPDMRAVGPRDRTADEGFDVGFEDLPSGHLNELNPAYFQTMDVLMDVLVEHEVVPVYQPVFHGYGWKGLGVAGTVVPPEEYARYCRYLVARYGARPAIWLVGGDGQGYAPQVAAGGREVESWDCYGQPTGIHYAPHADNRAHQEAGWLDFQWCQTGHNGEHVPERVADMWRNTPAKGVANGEPTYEHIGRRGKAVGWWQGHEAWCNLCAGGTMGVVYGAGSLWQWRLHAEEPGHEAWAHAPGFGWREALEFEGSRYIGVIPRIFEGLPFAEMRPNWDYTIGRRALAVDGKLLVVYLPDGGMAMVVSDQVPRPYRIVDPRSGKVIARGEWSREASIVSAPEGAPAVIIFAQPDGHESIA